MEEIMKILTTENYELISFNDLTNVRFYTSIDPGSYVAPHWHDAIEIVLLEEGSLTFFIENRSFDIKENQCILINSNVIHATLCTSPNRAIVFQIPITFIEKYIPEAFYIRFHLIDPAMNPIQQTKVDQFKDILYDMQTLVDTQSEGATLKFNSFLYDILFRLYHDFKSITTKNIMKSNNKNLSKIAPVLEYTIRNYNRPISLDEIASIAMLEKKYFCRLFKNCMGLTFLEYQNEVRLSKIYEDLIQTNDKVIDILERHGFTNYKLFRKTFYEHFKTTPTKLREKIKNQPKTNQFDPLLSQTY